MLCTSSVVLVEDLNISFSSIVKMANCCDFGFEVYKCCVAMRRTMQQA